jgi:uncharacterized membrane protein YidH (DUF202 family)
MAQRIFSSSDFQNPPARGARSRGGSVASRVISALIGLIVTGPALLLVMAGGSRAYSETLQRANTEPMPGAVLMLAAGLALVLVVVLTGLFSALGPLVAGLVATGLGIAFLVSPDLIETVAEPLPPLGVSPVTLLVFWCQSGLLLATGIVLLATALGRLIAARTGRGSRGGARAIVSLVVALVATPLGLALVAVGSSGLLRASSTASEATAGEPGTLGVLLAGAAVLGGVALTTGWSSVGAAVAGVLALLVGLLAVVPSAVQWILDTASARLGEDVASGVTFVVALGFVAVFGTVLVGAAASGARARRSGR